MAEESATLPRYDRNATGPWFPATGSHERGGAQVVGHATATRCLVLNLAASRLKAGETIQARLGETALAPLVRLFEAAPTAPALRRMWRWHTEAIQKPHDGGFAPSFAFAIETVLCADGRGVAGLRLWKWVFEPHYSDALIMQQHLESEKDKQPMLRRLLNWYHVYGGLSSGLFDDWNEHLSKGETGGDPMVTPLLSEWSGRKAVHVLSPEAVLDPLVNPKALSAGFEGAVLPSQVDAASYRIHPISVPDVVSNRKLLHVLDSGFLSPLAVPLPKCVTMALDDALKHSQRRRAVDSMRHLLPKRKKPDGAMSNESPTKR